MAKAPKLELGLFESKASKLRQLNKLGLSDHKTFSKTAQKVWTDFTAAFPDGKPPKNAVFIKTSDAAKKACASVNMLTVGNAVLFPTRAGGSVKIRETKHGVFIDYGPTGARPDTIILSKKGDHLKYGMKLAKRETRRQQSKENYNVMWGTLKTHAYNTNKNGMGEMIRGFMRDTARSYENPMQAVIDDRYAVDKLDAAVEDVEMTSEFIDRLQETNGTAALIRVSF